MKSVRWSVGAFVLAVLLRAAPAVAMGSEFGLGADYVADDNAGAFLGTVALDTALARHTTLGARFGLALESGPSRLALPLDARLRFRIRRIYLEGLAGAWIFFKGNDKLRFHAAAGGGLVLNRSVRLGLELGYLDPSSMIGARVAFAF
jgi:hypothetical protein